MHFRLEEEQEMTRSVVREWADQELEPGATERDEAARFDRRLLERLGALGLAGIPWPENAGGAGGGYVAFAVVIEELSRVCASTAASLIAHTRSSYPVFRLGNRQQHETVLKAMAGGRLLGACLLPLETGRIGEAAAEAAGVAGVLEDEAYVLSGKSPYVDLAGEADVVVVFARLNLGKNRRRKEWSAFLLDKGAEGLQIGELQSKLGLRGVPTGSVRLTDCRIPKSRLLGHGAAAYECALTAIDIGWLGSAALAVGLAQRAMEEATAYAKQRTQFGKPISQHQAVLFKLADMAVQVEAARLLVYQAAWLADAGLPFRREAALAGSYAGRTAESVTLEAVQVFGGYGYMREYKVERYMRDAKCLAAAAGTGAMRQALVNSSLGSPNTVEP
ncbi:acyl-CoA dehydrogenase family protein [Paenibacillus sp. HJGM_3]|uniref:acyl-CoA dehydrogenase family protein n=1 Tax=Paenibacillus sp. HJGM_3 TaxID=3379816 RepID=UPI00385AF2E0